MEVIEAYGLVEDVVRLFGKCHFFYFIDCTLCKDSAN
jgi:hypothetical protein